MGEREVDPTVSRALRLMMTRTKESQEQLRLLLEDEIRKRTGKSMGHLLCPIETISDSTESNSRQKALENRTVSLHIEDSSKDSHITEVYQEDSETEINIEILEEDLACVVCRGMDVAPRNRLIECTGCHSLYHQECHRPPVSEDDMEDPRSIWYCTNCTKTMARPVASEELKQHSSLASTFQSVKTQVSKSSTPSKPVNKEPVNPVTKDSGKESVLRAKNQTLVFKRTEKPFQMSSGSATSRSTSQSPGSPQSSSKPSGKRPTLLSSFMPSSKSFGGSSGSSTSSTKQSGQSASASSPASASGTPSPPSSTHSASNSTSSSSKSSMAPKINVISADKRIANMKKKAAKLQEKRKHSK